MELRLLLIAELLWLAVIAVVSVLVLYPIWNAGISWPFQTWNIVSIAALITFSRHIFLLKYSLIAKKQILKTAIIIAFVPLAFACIANINEFMVFVEEQTWDNITGGLPLKQKTALESYMWNEMLFFSVGTLIAMPFLAVRLFMSVWKQHNNRRDSF